jgi:phospholipid/cholesterol/gamma-HCH transport system permease protein
MKSRDHTAPVASVRIEPAEKGTVRLVLGGRLDVHGTGKIWRQVVHALEKSRANIVIADAGAVDYCDAAGIGLLLDLQRRQNRVGGTLEIHNLREDFRHFLDLFDPADMTVPTHSRERAQPLLEQTGRLAARLLEDCRISIAFLGEVAVGFGRALIHPGRVRWRDVFLHMEKVGANALPIVVLISFLVGLIMAFQSAIAMRQFGAEIFVANLVAVSMLRELGPLMTAIVLAGRSGSSFAAEIGTMKINEEIDALVTFGLDPVRFLVIPRMLAAFLVTPVLVVFADIVGVAGGSLVMLSMGYPLATYVNQALGAVSYGDFAGGLLKAFVFGILIAAIGCLRGLQTGTGASAVGDSATRAVVSGIIMIVVVDGVFAVIYYVLGV